MSIYASLAGRTERSHPPDYVINLSKKYDNVRNKQICDIIRHVLDECHDHPLSLQVRYLFCG